VSVTFRRCWFGVTDWLWPRACLLCDAAIIEPADRCVCGPCATTLSTDPHATCPRCASTVGPHADTAGGCPRCRDERYRFAGVTRLGGYDGPLRDAILRAKRSGQDTLAEALGFLFGTARRGQLFATKSDCVVPVPLHWRRWWGRGHNQAEGIARGVAAALGLPVRPRVLRRVKYAPMQTTVSPTERRRNLIGAFRLRPFAAVQGLRPLLIDDVLTTGATANAAAEALLAGGAAQVTVGVLAHR
jgi:ComF family protein